MYSSTPALADHFRSQAEWRDAKAEEYPDDTRNAQSARALRSLAEYVESGEADARDSSVVEALELHLFEDGVLGGEAAQREVSRYGYGYEATNPNQHEAFLAELWVICIEDAYEFARGGEDPTDTLHPFEVEAAKDRVHLPRRYWELRPNSTEPDLEEAVESYRGDPEGGE